MPKMVSDEVWQQLDPYAGRLPERTTRRLWWAGVAMSVVVALAAAAWYGGFVVPQLRADGGQSGSSTITEPLDITSEVRIRNDGWVSIRVTDAGLRGPGLRLEGVTGGFPHTLVPGESMTFTLRYLVTDCAAARGTNWAVLVHVDRPWGTQTAELVQHAEQSLVAVACSLPPR
jgi:hypothetical protein